MANQLAEMAGIQFNTHWQSTSLAPRFEAMVNGCLYSTANDASPVKEYIQTSHGMAMVIQSKLVNENQQSLPDTPVCEIRFSLVSNEFIMQAKCNATAAVQQPTYVLPLMSNNKEKIWVLSPSRLEVVKSGTVVCIQANKPFKTAGKRNETIMGFVPGSETVLLEFVESEIEIKIRVA